MRGRRGDPPPPRLEGSVKLRNDSEVDRFMFGLHFAAGATVDVPDTMAPEKLAQLRRNFTEMTKLDVAMDEVAEMIAVARSAVVQPEPEPEPEKASTDPVWNEPLATPPARKQWRGRRRS